MSDFMAICQILPPQIYIFAGISIPSKSSARVITKSAFSIIQRRADFTLSSAVEIGAFS